jgi:hypothetical protein
VLGVVAGEVAPAFGGTATATVALYFCDLFGGHADKKHTQMETARNFLPDWPEVSLGLICIFSSWTDEGADKKRVLNSKTTRVPEEEEPISWKSLNCRF